MQLLSEWNRFFYFWGTYTRIQEIFLPRAEAILIYPNNFRDYSYIVECFCGFFRTIFLPIQFRLFYMLALPLRLPIYWAISSKGKRPRWMNNVKTGLSTQNDIDGSTINSDDCDKHFSKNVYEEIWIRLNRAAKGWNRPNPNLPLSLALWLSRLRFRKDPHHWNNKTKNTLTSTLAGATRR